MIDARKTLGEIATDFPAAMRVFERHGIDYACHGERTLVGVCGEHDLAVERIIAEIEAAQTPSLRLRAKFDDLAELVDHIVSTHHTFARTELGRLVPLAVEVERAHAAQHPELSRVRELVRGLDARLQAQLLEEERVLFPYLVALEAAAAEHAGRPAAPFSTVRTPTQALHHEHESVAAILRELRSLMIGYVPPDDAGERYRALCAGLAALERDLLEHMHLENNVAFPAAERLERELAPASH